MYRVQSIFTREKKITVLCTAYRGPLFILSGFPRIRHSYLSATAAHLVFVSVATDNIATQQCAEIPTGINRSVRQNTTKIGLILYASKGGTICRFASSTLWIDLRMMNQDALRGVFWVFPWVKIKPLYLDVIAETLSHLLRLCYRVKIVV